MEFNKNNISEVLAYLTVNQKTGIPINTIQNYVNIFEYDDNLRNLIVYNEISQYPETKNGEQWRESFDSEIKCYIQNSYGIKNTDCYDNAFNIICNRRTYNPIKRILERNQWDGKPHINKLLQTFLKCEDTPYTREVARLIFAGGIARLYSPGIKYDYMTILIGEQGTAKSSFVAWLALQDRFFNEIKTINGKEGSESIQGFWICEVSELLALTKHAEIEAVKSYVTRQSDNYRKPYDRRVTQNPRQCIMIGTTNRTQFLTDKTGNRRFIPIQTHNTGFELFAKQSECKSEILQCWLEALHNWNEKNAESKTIPSENVLQEIENRQKQVVEDDWRIGVIQKYIEDKKVVCVKELWDKAMNYSNRDCTKKDSNDIVEIMNNFKEWDKQNSIRFKDYGIQRGWRKKQTIEPQTPLIPIPDDDASADDLPF